MEIRKNTCSLLLLLSCIAGYGQYTGDDPTNYNNDANRARRASVKQDEDFAEKNRAPNKPATKYVPLSQSEMEALNDWWKNLKASYNPSAPAPGTAGGRFTESQRAEFSDVATKRLRAQYYSTSVVKRYHGPFEKLVPKMTSFQLPCQSGDCENGIGESKNEDFERISTYKDGKLDGIATFYVSDPMVKVVNVTYENNILNGPGTIKYHDGSFENFIFSYNKLGGEASLSLPNEDHVAFNYNDGKISGLLKYYYGGGGSCQSLYRDNEVFTTFLIFNLNADFYYPSEGMYKGQFYHYIKEEDMTKVFDDDGQGGFYAGEMKEDTDMYHGLGHRAWKSGTSCYGTFVNWSCTGEATFYYANGEIYKGTVKNAERNGYGTHYYANGNKYTGQWKKGQWTGKGRFEYADGTVYEGNFKEGDFGGKGTMTYADGYHYTGEWKKGKREGKGINTRTSDGYYVKGTFKDNLNDKVTYYNNNHEVISQEQFNGHTPQ